MLFLHTSHTNFYKLLYAPNTHVFQDILNLFILFQILYILMTYFDIYLHDIFYMVYFTWRIQNYFLSFFYQWASVGYGSSLTSSAFISEGYILKICIAEKKAFMFLSPINIVPLLSTPPKNTANYIPTSNKIFLIISNLYITSI